MINPTSPPVVLTAGERARLAAWADDPAAGPLAARARIVLACAAGPPDLPGGRPVSRVAAELGLSRDTVRKWRSRFVAERLAGLRDAPRPGAPRTITDEQVARVIARALEAPPAGRRQWSTRLMAAETGVSQSAVSRIWRQAGLSDPGRLDFTRIGDNDRMGSMQAGFEPQEVPPEPPDPGERIPGQRVS
ncbi:MAG TPA: helix-turn-helix domain-containing protein, partial [Streptosporangiaceae bacterium]